MTTATVSNNVDSKVFWVTSNVAAPCDFSRDRICVTHSEPSDPQTLLEPNVQLAARVATPSFAEKNPNGVSDTVTIVVLLAICTTALTAMGVMASNVFSSMLQFSTFDIVRMLGI